MCWVLCLSCISDLHDCTALVSPGSAIDDVLEPPVRQDHSVLALDVAGPVPRPLLREVRVVVTHPVQEGEGLVGLSVRCGQTETS